jgi:regulation of enolase protein 1 (concanavalin A-like superfamily)
VLKSLRQSGALSIVVAVCTLVGGARESRAQGTLPSGWTSRGIGVSSSSGYVTVAGDTWSIAGGGANIWGTSDQFQFVSRSVTGDVDVRVRLDSFLSDSEWAKAGVMIRESLAGNARNAYMLYAPGLGHAFQYRSATSGTTTRVAGEAGKPPTWLRIVRRGSQFTAYTSGDGQSWKTVSTAAISMQSTVYVGLAVTSRGDGIATAAFSGVDTEATEAFQTDTQQSGVSGSGSWANRDIGSPEIAGTASRSGDTFTVIGAGEDIWATSDQFHFVHQSSPLAGDVEIVARVGSLERTDTWSKAGVMIRESLSETSKHAFMIASGSEGWHFQRRMSSGGDSNSTGGHSGSAPGWVRLVREGSLFSAYFSADGSNWTLVGTDTIAMASSVYVGLAVTSHNPYSAATATFTDVTVRTPSSSDSGGSNQPPSVSLTSPSEGASFTRPATIYLAATASDPDGSIARVDLYQGSTLLKADYTNPYSFNWTDVPSGTYEFTAVAVDNEGARRTSAPVTVTVGSGSNQLPSVAITSPSNGALYSAPASMTIAASASDPDGTITRVDFYSGSQLIGSDTSSPYTMAWGNVPLGSYNLTAVARDNAGGTRASAVVSINVGTTSTRPTSLVFTMSSDHTTNVTSYTVALYRSVDPVTASPVATRDLGKPTPSDGEITVDISTLVGPLPSGSYYAVVRAVGPGGTTPSQPSATFSK